MRAIQLDKPESFRRVEINALANPGPGEALVRVRRVGVCGTDISGYLGKMPFFTYPVIPGHELGVEVVEVGAGVDHLQVGTRCSVEPYLNNPESFASRRGRTNCCEELKVLGVHRDGGLCDQLLLPAHKLHPSASLEYDQLALVETLGIGCHAIQRAGVEAGENVLVIGAGPIGLSVIEFARIAGANVTVLDLNQKRLDFCQDKMGVKHAIRFTTDDEVKAAFLEITNGHGFTCVLDASGSHKSMSAAAWFLAHTGRLVFVGVTTEELHFPHPLLHRRELTLMSSRNALPEDFTRIIRLIEQGTIDTQPWITHRATFDNVIEEFPSYTRPETGVIKAMVSLD